MKYRLDSKRTSERFPASSPCGLFSGSRLLWWTATCTVPELGNHSFPVPGFLRWSQGCGSHNTVFGVSELLPSWVLMPASVSPPSPPPQQSRSDQGDLGNCAGWWPSCCGPSLCTLKSRPLWMLYNIHDHLLHTLAPCPSKYNLTSFISIG